MFGVILELLLNKDKTIGKVYTIQQCTLALNPCIIHNGYHNTVYCCITRVKVLSMLSPVCKLSSVAKRCWLTEAVAVCRIGYVMHILVSLLGSQLVKNSHQF